MTIPCEKDIDLRMMPVEAAILGRVAQVLVDPAFQAQMLRQLSEGLLKFSPAVFYKSSLPQRSHNLLAHISRFHFLNDN